MIRSAGTAAVALFLVAGAALATSSFIAGGRTDDSTPASTSTDTTAISDGTATPEADRDPGGHRDP